VGEWSGLTVVITGAGGGIGSAMCRLSAADGAHVVALDRDVDGLSRLGDTVRRSMVLDITDADQVGAAFDSIGRVDVLINNAGVTAIGGFADIGAESFDRVMAVNLAGAVNCTRAALPALLDSKGRIGVMSSVAGFAPLVNRTAYSASKHALHGAFESLRAELAGTGVSVTMVCPSFTATGIETRAVERAGGEAGSWSTTGEILTPERVALATLEGVRKRRRLVLPSRTARLAWAVNRVSPALYDWSMRRSVR